MNLHRIGTLLLVISLFAAAPAAASGPDWLALLERFDGLVDDPALAEFSDRVKKLRGDAGEALDAGRPHEHLKQFVEALEIMAAFAYRGEHAEQEDDLEAFEAVWKRHSSLPADAERMLDSGHCDGSPALVRAVAERSLNKLPRLYSASRAQAGMAGAGAGWFYLGRALAHLEVASELCAESEATQSRPPEVLSLDAELERVERAIEEAYAVPGAALAKHGRFIRLNAMAKELRELNAAGRRLGALHAYLEIVRDLELLEAESVSDSDTLAGRASEEHAALSDTSIDHGVALAFLESAMHVLGDDESEPDARMQAAAVVGRVVPAYRDRTRWERP